MVAICLFLLSASETTRRLAHSIHTKSIVFLTTKVLAAPALVPIPGNGLNVLEGNLLAGQRVEDRLVNSELRNEQHLLEAKELGLLGTRLD